MSSLSKIYFENSDHSVLVPVWHLSISMASRKRPAPMFDFISIPRNISVIPDAKTECCKSTCCGANSTQLTAWLLGWLASEGWTTAEIGRCSKRCNGEQYNSHISSCSRSTKWACDLLQFDWLANIGKFLRPGEKRGFGNRPFMMSCPSTAGEKSIEDRAAAKHAKQI